MAAVIEESVVSIEHPLMRWGAVWAGWLVATGIAVLLYTFGLAVGLSSFNVNDQAAIARGISAGAVIWMLLTWAASLWLGGMFATWFDGRNDTEMGVIRGLAVWGLSITATVLLAGSGLLHLSFSTVAPDPNAPTVNAAMVAHYTAATMWTAFGCAIVSLITSAFGGWMGAHHVHHVYHLRRYRSHGP